MSRNAPPDADVVRLCELAIERDRLLTSRELQIARLFRNAGRSILDSARTCLRLPRELWRVARAGEDGTGDEGHDVGRTPLEKTFDVDPRYVYRLTGSVLTQGGHNSKSAMVTVSYADGDDHLVGVEQKQFSFSDTHGFYRYLAGSPDGAKFSLVLQPAAEAATATVRVRHWAGAASTRVREVKVQPVDLTLTARLAQLEGALRALESSALESLVVVQVDRTDAPELDELEVAPPDGRHRTLVVYDTVAAGFDPRATATHGPLFVSSDAFEQVFRRVARVRAQRRRLLLSSASFRSVLLANLFRYHGWELSTTASYDSGALSRDTSVKQHYLDEFIGR